MILLALALAHRPTLAAERTPAPVAPRTAPPASLPVAASWITDASETVPTKQWILSHVAPPDGLATCEWFLKDISLQAAKRTLQGYVIPEKAYFQEKDAFGPPSRLGDYSSDVPTVSVCWKFVGTVGQLSGAGPRTSWVMTMQPFRWYDDTPLPGPWYCVTNLAGAHPAFTLGVSPTGPIADGPSCARQPSGDSWTPPAAFFVPPIRKR